MSKIQKQNLIGNIASRIHGKQARIPISSPKRSLDRHADEIRAAIDRVLSSGWFVGGSEIKAFESEFADYLGANYTIGVASGTDALELALRACGIVSGDYVATVSFGAGATVAAIERCGAMPLLIDIDPCTLTISPSALATLCKRLPIKAVIPVHLYGSPADMWGILEVAAKYQVVVIEDCAQAHGAHLEGKACGTFGDIAAFSFYPTKNLGALGDAGAVVTNNSDLADRIRLLREYGWRKKHFSEISGVNSRIDTVQAAVLRVKLRYLDTDNHRRSEIARQYLDALTGTGLRVPMPIAGGKSVYHQFVVRAHDRKELKQHLALKGVDTAIHYEHPIHLQPAYSKRKLSAGERLNETELACQEVLSLPVFPELTKHEIDHIVLSLSSFHDIQQIDASSTVSMTLPSHKLSVSRPVVGGDELRAVAQVFESAWLGQGSKVLEFEKALSEMFAHRNVIAVSSGTAALHLVLNALGLKDGDEVIVPSLTFCATIQAITAVGATPIFCEIDPYTLNIDISDAASRITSRTQVILPVHYCGNACDMEALLQLATDKRLRVVEDAAHAFGSSFHGQLIGSFGYITCFSFDPIKNITCGEGGAIVLSDDDLADLIRRKRTVGISQDRWQRSNVDRPWWYQVDVQGYRYHMNNISASIGLVQLGQLPKFCSRKRELVHRYNERFSNLTDVQVLRWQLEDCCPFYYILRIKNGQRNQLISLLAAHGIDTGVHYIPNHLQPYFRKSSVVLPVTEQIFDEIITLPLHLAMTDMDVDRVADAVVQFFQEDQ